MIRIDRAIWIIALVSLNACVYAGSLAKNLKMINNITPCVVDEVPPPYKQEGLTAHASIPLHLELYYAESNRIVDEEEWFDQYGVRYPEAIATHISGIPQSTRFGNLKYLRVQNKKHYVIYETVFMLAEPKDIYNEGYSYTLVVFDIPRDTVIVFTLDILFPDILEMYWFDVVDNLVYFNATYNGYADILDKNTGYLYCLDIESGKIIWATKNLISSYCGFTVYKDHVITGYGFTAEPDFLYVLDRFNGDIVQTVPIKTAHEFIIIKNDKCYVRTYNMNYVYTIKE